MTLVIAKDFFNVGKRQIGYILDDGYVLLESEKIDHGLYKGGIILNGKLCHQDRLYYPIHNGKNRLIGFYWVTDEILKFSKTQLDIISQYADKKDIFINNLKEVIPQLKNKNMELCNEFILLVNKILDHSDEVIEIIIRDTCIIKKEQNLENIRLAQRKKYRELRRE